MNVIDAKGKACPMPVILAKKQLEQGESFQIQVDNPTAVENLKRLAASQGAAVAESAEAGVYTLTFTPGAGCAATPTAKSVFFFGKNGVGTGDDILGESLVKMLLYTLTQAEEAPEAVLLMNGGVRLAVEPETAQHLRTLEERGTEVLVCGTCLNFYGLAEQRKAGTVSNTYDILTAMQQAEKVITF